MLQTDDRQTDGRTTTYSERERVPDSVIVIISAHVSILKNSSSKPAHSVRKIL